MNHRSARLGPSRPLLIGRSTGIAKLAPVTMVMICASEPRENPTLVRAIRKLQFALVSADRLFANYLGIR